MLSWELTCLCNIKSSAVHYGPSWALTLLRMISGARYSGVPQSVQVRPFTLFANPKSVTWGAECTALSTDHTLQEHRDQSNLRVIDEQEKQTWNPCLYVTLLVNEQVLRLKISVDEIQRVKVFKGQYNLRCVEAGVWFTGKQTSTVFTVNQWYMEIFRS